MLLYKLKDAGKFLFNRWGEGTHLGGLQETSWTLYKLAQFDQKRTEAGHEPASVTGKQIKKRGMQGFGGAVWPPKNNAGNQVAGKAPGQTG